MFEDINHFITLHQRESIFAFINKGHNTSVSDTSGNYINVTNPIKLKYTFIGDVSHAKYE